MLFRKPQVPLTAAEVSLELSPLLAEDPSKARTETNTRGKRRQ